MATIKTVQFVCPECNQKVGLTRIPQRWLKYYGCRMRTCKRCGASYYDWRISEIGLYSKQESYPTPIRPVYQWIIAYAISIFGFLYGLTKGGLAAVFVFTFAVTLVAHIASDLILYSARKKAWQREYDKSQTMLLIPGYREKVTAEK